MGKESIKDIVLSWYWTQMRKIMNFVLLHYGYDFGEFYMEELHKMYSANEKDIKRD